MKHETDRKPLFSLTAKDFDWSYARGTGNGGQARNRSNNAVHCHHRPSGAHGYSEASRSQHANKISAFMKMAETKEFLEWHRKESMIRSGVMQEIDSYVERELRNIKIEVMDDGRWVQVRESDLTNGE